jgi:hypothetical protein
MSPSPKLFRVIRLLLVSLLLGHGAITLHSVRVHGILSPFPPFNDWRSLQLFSDLGVCSILLLALLLHTLKRQGRSMTRWGSALVVGVVLTGSIAPLLFMICDSRFLSDLLSESVRSD